MGRFGQPKLAGCGILISMSEDVYILSAVRSPVGVGKPNGCLAALSPVKLSALILQEAVRRAGIEPQVVEDVVWGCVTQIGRASCRERV